jgi:hypothetical protein
VRLHLKAVAALVIVAALASTSPAAASGPGGMALVGHASLPAFPCGSGCPGSFTGTESVSADGTGVGLDTVRASFTYRDTCIAGEPMAGSADGTITSIRFGMRPFHADRYGLVLLVTGDVLGPLLFIPTPLPACDSSSAVNATIVGTILWP